MIFLRKLLRILSAILAAIQCTASVEPSQPGIEIQYRHSHRPRFILVSPEVQQQQNQHRSSQPSVYGRQRVPRQHSSRAHQPTAQDFSVPQRQHGANNSSAESQAQLQQQQLFESGMTLLHYFRHLNSSLQEKALLALLHAVKTNNITNITGSSFYEIRPRYREDGLAGNYEYTEEELQKQLEGESNPAGQGQIMKGQGFPRISSQQQQQGGPRHRQQGLANAQAPQNDQKKQKDQKAKSRPTQQHMRVNGKPAGSTSDSSLLEQSENFRPGLRPSPRTAAGSDDFADIPELRGYEREFGDCTGGDILFPNRAEPGMKMKQLKDCAAACSAMDNCRMFLWFYYMSEASRICHPKDYICPPPRIHSEDQSHYQLFIKSPSLFINSKLPGLVVPGSIYGAKTQSTQSAKNQGNPVIISGYDFSQGDCPGHDILFFNRSSPGIEMKDVSQCAAVCSEWTVCKAFVWFSVPSSDSSATVCFLKDQQCPSAKDRVKDAFNKLDAYFGCYSKQLANIRQPVVSDVSAPVPLAENYNRFVDFSRPSRQPLQLQANNLFPLTFNAASSSYNYNNVYPFLTLRQRDDALPVQKAKVQ